METCIDIDVTPLPNPLLVDGPLTGRTFTVPSGKYAGRSLLTGKLFRCRLTSSRQFYVVTVGSATLFAAAELLDQMA